MSLNDKNLKSNSEAEAKATVRPIAVVIGLVIVVLLGILNVSGDIFLKYPLPDLAGTPSTIGITLIVIFTFVNLGLRYFSKLEILSIYGISYIGGIMVKWTNYMIYTMAHDGKQVLLEGDLSLQSWFDKLSPLIAPKSEEAIIGFYMGGPVPWGEWIIPMLMWGLFGLVTIFIQFSLVSLVEHHWSQREHLAYPLAQVIVEMSGGEDTTGVKGKFAEFWGNKILWIGMLVPILIYGINGLNRYFPGIPRIPLGPWYLYTFARGDVAAALKWNYNAFGFAINPLISAMGYFINTDILFSTWIFNFVRKPLENLFLYNAGKMDGMHQRWLIIEMAGAYTGLAILTLWMSKEDIIKGLRRSFISDDKNDAIAPRFALFGFIGGMAFLVLFSVIFSSAGVIYALGYFLMFSAISLAYARLRAEMGYPSWAPFAQTWDFSMLLTFGVQGWGNGLIGQSSARFSGKMYGAFTFNAIQGVSGAFTEQLKIAELTDSKKSVPIKLFILAAVVGIISSFTFALPSIYKTGAISTNSHYLIQGSYLSKYANDWFAKISGWSDLKIAPGIFRFGVIGMGLTFSLMYMTGRFIWWPFHPIGYVLGGGHLGTSFGGPFLVTWLFKIMILRWGGANLYRKLAPFFKGIIAGTLLMNALWGVVGIVVGH